jgi:hypothetical protein
MENLIGLFVYRNTGDTYRTGEVMAVVNKAVLVQFDIMDGTTDVDWSWPLELVSVKQMMTETTDDDIKAWGFFPNREAMMAFINWSQSPDDKTPATPGYQELPRVKGKDRK